MKMIEIILIFFFGLVLFSLTANAAQLTTFNTSFTGSVSTNPSDWINNTVTGGLLCGGYFPNTTTLCNGMDNTSAYYRIIGAGCTVDVGPGFMRVQDCSVPPGAGQGGLMSGGTSPLLPRGTACDFIFRASSDTLVQMGLDDDTGYAGGDDTQITAGTLGTGANAKKILLHYGANLFSAGGFLAKYDKQNNLTVVSNYSAGEGRYYINNTEDGDVGVGGVHCENCNLSILSSPQNQGEANNFNLTWFACYNISKGAPQAAVVVGDVSPPKINMSLNDTSLNQNDGVNISANISDDTGLSFCRFVINQTGAKQFFNKSVTGTNDRCSQNFTIALGNGGVINFTVIVNDTSNNVNQSEQTVTIADITAPTITGIRLQHFNGLINKTNTNRLQINCSDSESFLDRINFTIRFNQTTQNLTRFFELRPSGGGDLGLFGEGGSGGNIDTRSYIWNYTLFSADETATEGYWNVTDVGCTDRPKNYAKNDSSNRLAGLDFLMDTPPTINSRSPANNGIVTDTEVTGNAIITEDNPSFMLIYHNITGIYHLNQTTNYSGNGVTGNDFNLSGINRGSTYAYSVSLNSSFGTWTNSSNFTFTVSLPSEGGGSSGGGGGGGGGFETKVVFENATPEQILKVTCGNRVCDENEGPTNCYQDCPVNVDVLISGEVFGQAWFSRFLVYFLVALVIISVVKSQKKKERMR